MDYYAIVSEEAERLRQENPSIQRGSGRIRSNHGNRRQGSSFDDRPRNDSYGRSNRDEDDRYGRSRYEDRSVRNTSYGGGGGYGSRNYDRDDDNSYKGASKWTSAEPEKSSSKWTESDPSSGGGGRYGGSYDRNNDGGGRNGRNDYSRQSSYDRPRRDDDGGGRRSYDRGNREDNYSSSKWTQGDSDNRDSSYGKKNDYYGSSRDGGRNRDDNYSSSKWTQGDSDNRDSSYGKKNDYYGSSRDGGGGGGGGGRNRDDNYSSSKWTQGDSDNRDSSYGKKNDYYGSSRDGGRNRDDNYSSSKWTQGDTDTQEDSYSKKNDYYGRNEDSNRGKTDDYQTSKWTQVDPGESDAPDDNCESDRNVKEDSNRRYSGNSYGHDDRTSNKYENNYDNKPRKNGFNFDDCDYTKPPSDDDNEESLAKANSPKRTDVEPIYYSNSANDSNAEKENYAPSKSSLTDDRARKKSLSEVSNDRISTHSASKDTDGYNVDFDRFLVDYKPSNRLKTNHVVLDLTNDNHYDRLKQILQTSSQENLTMIIQMDDQKASEIAIGMQAEGIWVFNLSKDDENFEQTSKQHSVLRTPVVTYPFLANNPDVLKFPTIIVNYDFNWKRVKYLERYLRYRNDNEEPEVIIDIYHMALPETPNVDQVKSLFCD